MSIPFPFNFLAGTGLRFLFPFFLDRRLPSTLPLFLGVDVFPLESCRDFFCLFRFFPAL